MTDYGFHVARQGRADQPGHSLTSIICRTCGVGWAICYQNPETREISNHWIELHDNGHPPGYRPIVVMDCWEHAWVPDYKVTERAKYIEAYFRNLDYRACEARLIK